jgi:hypothetical protein
MTKTEEKKVFLIKNRNSLMSKLQEKTLALKREHPALQKKEFFKLFQCLWIIFALLDPDPDPGTPLNQDLIRIRIHSPDNLFNAPHSNF